MQENLINTLKVSSLRDIAENLSIEISGASNRKASYLEPLADVQLAAGDLRNLSLDTLKDLASFYEVEPEGNSGHKASYIQPLLAAMESEEAEIVIEESDLPEEEVEIVVEESDLHEEELWYRQVPDWAWLIAIVLILLAIWGIVSPRVQAQTVDLSPITESIGKVADAVSAVDEKVDSISDRVSDLENQEQVSQGEPTPVPTEEPEIEEPKAEEAELPDVLVGYIPVSLESGYEVFDLVEATDHFGPNWPEGTQQPSVGYSNPEEFSDGRTFMTRMPTKEGEVLAFVAQCVQIYGGEKICHNDNHGALVGLIVGAADKPVTLWDAELKTLIIPGGEQAWRAYLYELAALISSNKNGAPVEVIGAPVQ